MLSVDEALAHILSRAVPGKPQESSLADSLGKRLAADVSSDIDSPPHDKSIVDGFAIRSDDLRSGEAEFQVIEQVTAGDWPQHAITHGMATHIMTGAPIPAGADAVVMIERSNWTAEGAPASHVRLAETADVRPGQNILRQGRSLRRGQMILRAGRTLRPQEIGLLAEAGWARVPVFPRPSVAVMATGNELVTVDQQPGPGQIRNSNGPMLVAFAQSTGAQCTDLGIARDDRTDLAQRIEAGLHHDVLILSGGVSAGVFDLVPAVLAELGVKRIFHKIRLKPGKPLWFGESQHAGGTRLVFGLPGNPVSSLVGFELFVRPALAALAGEPAPAKPLEWIPLTERFHQRGDRVTYHPVALEVTDGMLQARPLPWLGSADLRTLTDADGLARFPEGNRVFDAGELVPVHRFTSDSGPAPCILS